MQKLPPKPGDLERLALWYASLPDDPGKPDNRYLVRSLRSLSRAVGIPMVHLRGVLVMARWHPYRPPKWQRGGGELNLWAPPEQICSLNEEEREWYKREFDCDDSAFDAANYPAQRWPFPQFA